MPPPLFCTLSFVDVDLKARIETSCKVIVIKNQVQKGKLRCRILHVLQIVRQLLELLPVFC